MGEGEIIEFYSGHDTLFFWNMDDYPVPVDTDLGSVCRNIEDALFLMGFEGHLDINVDCKKFKYNRDELLKAGSILYLPNIAEAYRRLDDVPTLHMSYYMLLMAEDTAPEHANVVVIAKPKREPNSELDRVMHCMKSRGHKVLLVEPPPDEEFLFSVDSLLNNSRLLGGLKPRSKKDLTRDELRRVYDWEYTQEDDGDDVSNLPNTKMLDFSEPLRHVKGDRTIIFWDAMDCPFPLSFSPDEIYEKIRSALLERDFSDNIFIWAYVDDYKKRSWRDKYLGNKTWDSRIYFLPGGDNASRRIRMINDMYLLSWDSPLRSHEGTLFLVSDHFRCHPDYNELFRSMKYRSYNLVLRIPSAHSNISESTDEWPRSLLDSTGTLVRVPRDYSNTSDTDECPRSPLDRSSTHFG